MIYKSLETDGTNTREVSSVMPKVLTGSISRIRLYLSDRQNYIFIHENLTTELSL